MSVSVFYAHRYSMYAINSYRACYFSTTLLVPLPRSLCTGLPHVLITGVASLHIMSYKSNFRDVVPSYNQQLPRVQYTMKNEFKGMKHDRETC